MKCVYQLSRSVIRCTGREAHTIADNATGRMLLRFVLYSCWSSFRHIVLMLHAVHLCISHCPRRARRAPHTLLLHLIVVFSEHGWTNTLYFYGFSLCGLGIASVSIFVMRHGRLFAALRRGFRVSTIERTTSIADGCRHDLYTKFRKTKTRKGGVLFWRPV